MQLNQTGCDASRRPHYIVLNNPTEMTFLQWSGIRDSPNEFL